MRALVIHNPASGPQSGDVFEFVRTALLPGDDFEIRATTSGDDVAFEVGDAGRFDLVVASGGDGTVSRVAYALRGTGIPVVVFPSGTANLLANNLQSATEPASIAAALRQGHLVTLDIGEMTYHTADGKTRSSGFLTMAGAGFDARIMQDSQELKPVFGQLSYYLSAFGNPNPTFSHLSMVLDQRPLEADGICVLAGVWGTVNPTFTLIPGSDPQDGLLDVAVVRSSTATKLIPAFIGSLLGQGVNDPDIDVYHVKELTVSCDPPLPMQFDGEVVEDATTPFGMRVIPGGLTTIVDKLSPFYETGTPITFE